MSSESSGPFESLSETQRIAVGVVGILLGAALLALMAFTNLTSGLGNVAVGIGGVLLAVVGTILLGTSETREQIV